MSKMGNYVVWCEEKGYTNDMGEVDSMEHVDEYMKYHNQIHEDWIKSIENYKDEPIVGQWQDYMEEDK